MDKDWTYLNVKIPVDLQQDLKEISFKKGYKIYSLVEYILSSYIEKEKRKDK